MTTEDDIEELERRDVDTAALLRRLDERSCDTYRTLQDLVDEVTRMGTSMISVENWKAAAELRINVLERDLTTLRSEHEALKRRASRGSLWDAEDAATRSATLAAIEKARLATERAARLANFRSIAAFVLAVVLIAVRIAFPNLFGGR